MGTYWGYARTYSVGRLKTFTAGKKSRSIDYQIQSLREYAEEAGLEFRPVTEEKTDFPSYSIEGLKEIAEQAVEGDYVGFYDDKVLEVNMAEALALVDKMVERGIKVQLGTRTIDKHRNEPSIVYISIFFIAVTVWLGYLFIRM